MDNIDWNAVSPAKMWRDWIVKSEAQWSETVSQLLKDERTGGALNRQLDEMQLMHRQFSELAQASLAAANLPSRSDFEALDERMGRLEDGLAQVAAALSQLSQALAALVTTDAAVAGSAPAFNKPARNRRPPAPAPVPAASSSAAELKNKPVRTRSKKA
jgi:seryl-tRNA synthetase